MVEQLRGLFEKFVNSPYYSIYVFKKWVDRCKKCIACQERKFEKETVTAPPQTLITYAYILSRTRPRSYPYRFVRRSSWGHSGSADEQGQYSAVPSVPATLVTSSKPACRLNYFITSYHPNFHIRLRKVSQVRKFTYRRGGEEGIH
jgi:hypothetical protein